MRPSDVDRGPNPDTAVNGHAAPRVLWAQMVPCIYHNDCGGPIEDRFGGLNPISSPDRYEPDRYQPDYEGWDDL